MDDERVKEIEQWRRATLYGSHPAGRKVDELIAEVRRLREENDQLRADLEFKSQPIVRYDDNQDVLDTLRAENARLREALGDLIKFYRDNHPDDFDCVKELGPWARAAALAGPEGGDDGP